VIKLDSGMMYKVLKKGFLFFFMKTLLAPPCVVAILDFVINVCGRHLFSSSCSGLRLTVNID